MYLEKATTSSSDQVSSDYVSPVDLHWLVSEFTAPEECDLSDDDNAVVYYVAGEKVSYQNCLRSKAACAIEMLLCRLYRSVYISCQQMRTLQRATRPEEYHSG